MAVPQFHRPTVALVNGDRDRLLVPVGVEFFDRVDVTAVSVEEIEAIVLHGAADPLGLPFITIAPIPPKLRGLCRLGYTEMTVFKRLT